MPLNLKNTKVLTQVIEDAQDFINRCTERRPYPDDEVLAAVKILSNRMFKEAPRPKILWLTNKLKQKDLKAPVVEKDELFSHNRTLSFFAEMRAMDSRLWSIENEVNNQYFGYYVSEENRAPEVLRTLLSSHVRRWNRNRVDEIINRTGLVRNRVHNLVGPVTTWSSRRRGLPSNFYASSADVLRRLDRYTKVFTMGRYYTDKKTAKLIDAVKKICVSLYSLIVINNKILMVELPKVFMDSRNMLHREDGPAVEFPRFKAGAYCLNNVLVTRELVTKDADKLSPILITKTRNAEVRREAVRKMGIDRIVNELADEVLDERDNYKLVNLKLEDEDQRWRGQRNRPYLIMTNPSTGDKHVEGVAPHCTTIDEALEYRNGTKEPPAVLT